MKYRFLILLLVIFSSCNLIISGSYPYSENYTFNISREELISKIKEFKEKNIEYKVMTTFENGERGELPDGMDPQDSFYAIYFYETDLNMTLLSVINMTKEIPTRPATIQLVRMTKSKNFGSWKTINTKELTKEQNIQIKRLFETQILDRLGVWKRD